MTPFFAELIGTALLILLGDGVVANVLLKGTKGENGGWIVITFGWGMAVFLAVFVVAAYSGAHINPAVSIGLWAGRRFPASELIPYILAQTVGAVFAAGVLYVIASGAAGFSLADGFAANGYGAHSPGGYSLTAGLTSEVVMTFVFLVVILGATDPRAPAGLAPIAIGLCLTLIHLVSIPVTNTSVNPARSTGPALFVGGWALSQLWLFWIAPIVGALLAGGFYRWLGGNDGEA